LLDHLRKAAVDCRVLAEQFGVTPAAVGIATAGWVDSGSGRVVYATENLHGWTGTPIADELQPAVGLPVAVENDANALAVAEKHFGAAKDCGDFVCVTLGTGVGGGCYVGGRLNRGAHFFANSLGHITIQADGLACSCGRKGCLEVYTNAAALLRYGGGAFADSEELIDAAASGNSAARAAIRTYSGYLAVGTASIINLLDPEMLIFSGGLVQKNACLLEDLRELIPAQVVAWDRRRAQVRFSQLGYFGGVLGAAAIAAESTETDWGG
jgi:predicted NBD/HSP70 family sugar kinase